VAATINSNTNLPVTATAATSTVTLTANNGGLCGNDIDLRLNYRGSAGGEVTPQGVTVAITAMSGGATNPSLTTALGNLAEQPYDFIVSPYSDSGTISALTAFMGPNGRWGYASQIYGHVFGAYRGTYGAQATFGTGLNDPHASFLGFYDSPSWCVEVGARVAGAAAESLKADPALPLQTLPISGMLAPPIQSRFSQAQRNTLLYDGVSTFTVGQDGTCAIEALITTYQKNAFGQPDDSYLRVETMFTLMAVIRNLKSVVTTKFARVKLAANGTRLPPGSNAVTPNVIRSELIAEYQSMEGDLVQDSADFAANLVVQQNSTNPNRVDVLWPGTLIDGLNIFAVLVQFQN
jgi:phage tail sheath gpL-like